MGYEFLLANQSQPITSGIAGIDGADGSLNEVLITLALLLVPSIYLMLNWQVEVVASDMQELAAHRGFDEQDLVLPQMISQADCDRLMDTVSFVLPRSSKGTTCRGKHTDIVHHQGRFTAFAAVYSWLPG